MCLCYIPADMPRATFFRCRTCREEEGGGILLYTPMKWKREGWIVKWRQVGTNICSGSVQLLVS